MIPAMEKKVNLKPVFSNRVHSDAWEGPCRTGKMEELTEEYIIPTVFDKRVVRVVSRAVAQAAQLRERPTLSLQPLDRGRNCHQSAQLQPRQFAHQGCQLPYLLRREPAFARLVADVDLQAQLKRRQVRRALLA